MNLDDVKKRGLSGREPKWMRQQREQSWMSFEEQEYPNWTRSKIPKIDIQAATILNFQEREEKPLEVKETPPSGIAGEIILVDGQVAELSLDPDLSYKGVIFCDMRTAILERADLLEQYLSSSTWGEEDKLSHFHKALWDNGYFLFVPAGVVVDLPLRVRVIQKNPDRSVLDRSAMIVERDASVTIEESYESESSSKEIRVCGTAVEVFAEENSRLQYYSNQSWASSCYDLSYRRLIAKRNAHIRSLFTLLGAGAGRSVITGDATESGASIEHDGILVAGNKERFKIIAELNHHDQHTEGMMKYKGILKDKAYSDLDGLISVDPKAVKTNSRLEEHTLLLSKDARCDALPALDINTDDVQVSHSASVSQADSEKLFYLMSRGLSEQEARKLIVQGFFENILEMIQNPKWYEDTKQRIEEKLSTPLS